MVKYIIETKDLTMRYRTGWSIFRRPDSSLDRPAVDRVNLHLREGEIFGLVGPNGAGKTTLIRVLTTMLLPTSGTARVAGFDVVKADYRVRRLVGLVTSNERSFYWRLTGRQNLEFFAELYHIPQREGWLWMNELLNLLGLADMADERFDRYSTGQKQRLALARGLLSKPRILLMDEPTKGVDPIGAAAIVTIIREQVIRLWNPTILVTSHNLSEIERLCRRIALMNHGRIVALGELDELRSMVAAADRYRLTVRNLSHADLKAIVSGSHAMEPIQLADRNGAVDLQVSFRRGSEGFPRLISGIVEEGGEVLRCTEVETSFDDVFHALISDPAEQDATTRRARI